MTQTNDIRREITRVLVNNLRVIGEDSISIGTTVDDLVELYTEMVEEELQKCIDIAENGDYTMFITNDLESLTTLDETMAIRKQARKEVADKLKQYLLKRTQEHI